MATDEIKALEERLKTASDDAISRLGAVTNIDDLRSLQNEVLGKKGSVGSMKSELGRLNSVDAKKEAGAMLNTVTEQLEAAFNARRELLEDVAFAQQVATERLDLTEHLSVARRGHSHLVTQATRRLEDVFTGLGFQIEYAQVASGSEHVGHDVCGVRRAWVSTVAHSHIACADPSYGKLETTDLCDHAGSRISSGYARRHTHAGVPSN
jgi:hypothetical protein